MNNTSRILLIPEMGIISGELLMPQSKHKHDSLGYQMQRTLVPPLSFRERGVEAHGQSLPKDEVGGDVMDVVTNGAEVTSYVADVSGHGFHAGVLMGMVKTAVRYGLRLGEPLVKLLDDLNQVLPGVKEPHMFVTLAALRFDGSGTAEYVSAGHVPLLHYRRSTGEVVKYRLPQLPLGLVAGGGYTSTQISHEAGDIFAMVTDGVLERGEEPDPDMGLDRLSKLLRNNADASLPDLTELIYADLDHCGRQHDDETVLLMRAHNENEADAQSTSAELRRKCVDDRAMLEATWRQLLDDLAEELSRE